MSIPPSSPRRAQRSARPPSGRQERASNRHQREADARRRRARGRLIWTGIGLVALALVAFAVWSNVSGSASADPVIDGVQCNTSEQLVYHIHVHLTIYDQGVPVTVPANTGIDTTKGCYYWLHTHDTTGVIHVESPTQKQYTLGDFFDIWGQKLTGSSFLTHGITSGHSLRAYVGTQLFTGDPRSITLTPHKQITLEYGPPWVTPTASFTFPAGE